MCHAQCVRNVCNHRHNDITRLILVQQKHSFLVIKVIFPFKSALQFENFDNFPRILVKLLPETIRNNAKESPNFQSSTFEVSRFSHQFPLEHSEQREYIRYLFIKLVSHTVRCCAAGNVEGKKVICKQT